ncbi:uncharacterized protein M421DRAFT_112105 [Didymella exigua CBS 183.55]|uniref:F-box domain-containing protein n=1 Tax=Didymella exigua CBS 183.55 TaxID=1150837 RepID=A0A6A5S2E0_9PLEO|nr:uncharacterized protein M421DRAFT_112105 [Didymella exigua CBS 183.55]KAF1934073.1 hypothetical protein M421DRAFT_112105 [Didymella exigua CBS 183.55]
MTTKLFYLPPEILLKILEALPVTPLLRFAQTSQYARNLAHSNLTSLSLAIHPSHRKSWHSKLLATSHKPKHALNAVIRIPRAWEFDYSTLIKFHDKIIASILTRHACALQKLDLTIWRLSKPIAKAIIKLPALRELSIRIETHQAIPRAHTTLQRKEEVEAWSILASNPGFIASVNVLAIANAEITTGQLQELITGAGRLRGLTLCSCDMLTSTLWSSENLRMLHHLSLTDCGNVHVNETAVGAISKMERLQELNLRGCSGLDGEVLEQWNRGVWRVPVFVAPSPRGALKEDMFIEVDPEYMIDFED